jgi:uncharacterized membrane protein
MTRYELFKLLHVVGAIAWLGSGIGLLVLHRQFVRAADHAGIAAILRQSKALGNRLFMPAALVTVVFGVALVATEPVFRFGDLWILIGFGGIVASGVAQMAVAEPASKRFMALLTEHDADHPELPAVARRMGVGNSLDVAVLIVVVWAMVARPML